MRRQGNTFGASLVAAAVNGVAFARIELMTGPRNLGIVWRCFLGKNS
jgi:hypothetical protein